MSHFEKTIGRPESQSKVLNIRQIKIREKAATVNHTVFEELSRRELDMRWVPRLVNLEQFKGNESIFSK